MHLIVNPSFVKNVKLKGESTRFSICQIVSPWKGYLKKSQRIDWQEGFFEHCTRDRESLEEKELYLKMNPVRTDRSMLRKNALTHGAESSF